MALRIPFALFLSIAATFPLDRAKVAVTSIARQAADFKLKPRPHLSTPVPRHLSSGAWTGLGTPVAGADAAVTFTAGGAAAPRRFYRVEAQP